MEIKPNPEYVLTAKELIGKKAVLTGGGMSVQYIYIVIVKAVTDDGHAVVETYWDYPYEKTSEFTPLLMSWQIIPLDPKYDHLPLGRYDRIAGQRDKPREPLVLIKEKEKHGTG